MQLVFDTTALSQVLASDDNLLRALHQQSWEQLLIPLAVDAELRFGFKAGNRERQNLQVYETFVNEFSLAISYPDQTTSLIYADLAAWCRQKGLSLSNNDLWIAASCVQHAGKLLTLDGDFKQLPQVNLLLV